MMMNLTRRCAVDDGEAERGIAALYGAIRSLGEATQAMVIGVAVEMNHQIDQASSLLAETRRIAVAHSDEELLAAVDRARRVVVALKAARP